MIPRLVRSVLVGAVALSAASASAHAFVPAALKQSQAAKPHAIPVHDRSHHGRVQHFAPPVVVVRPHRQVRDGLCVTRQPVTSMSCYTYLREQQFHPRVVHHGHVHGDGCGHTPRWAYRHNQIVFLGWF